MINFFANQSFFIELKKILSSAQDQICIVIYNWHFYKNDIAGSVSQLNQIIFDKKNKGVKIKVVVGNLTLYNQLKQKGVHVKYNRVRGLNHAKVIIVDKNICSVGSHNFSENAFSRNEEASIISDDKEFVAQAQKYFDLLFNACR
jgi:phosphatidylserine/phosphatidylglycerophosphate/cardiolipin synthase-like enzyme